MKKYAIFLCDAEWRILKTLHLDPGSPQPEKYLTASLADPSVLQELPAQNQQALTLRLRNGQMVPAILCRYPKRWLVFLVEVSSQEDFVTFSTVYMRCTAWAEEAFREYQDGYFQIQQMNNRLINSQRALTQSNRRLKRALDDIRQANDLITLLEQDEQTGLLRAPALHRRANQKLSAEPGRTFDFIALEIHSLRIVNELFGHKMGSRLLQDAALFLGGIPGMEQGLLGHFAGNAFLVFAPGELRLYETIQQELTAYLKGYPLPAQLRVRMGICTAAGGTASSEEMYDRARLALDSIQDKPEETRAFFTDELHEKLLLQHRVLDSLPEAIRNGEVQLYLQPKVQLTDGAVIGAEALVRWFHPELGFISPAVFIPVLEKENAIYPLDRFIWEKACEVLHKRDLQGLPKLRVSVNVARNDFYQPDLLEFLEHLIKTYELEPDQLRLEILERAYVNDSARLQQVLTSLREHGFCIEMDDFGVGESSLAMLADVPVDVIKLDRTFLISAEQNPRHVEVIRCIIQLARTLDIGIIAEGVETPEQAQLLLSLGCNHAQGFLYGRPQPAENFLK